MSLLSICLCLNVYQGKAQTSGLTAQEKDKAIQLLTSTATAVANNLKGLSKAQLSYKPSVDKWSVQECLMHIAAAETTLWAMVDTSLKQPKNPEARAGIKLTDEELIKAVEDRSHPSKTFAALEPANSPYQTLDQAIVAFQTNREKLIAFVKNTKADLRKHVLVLPLGTYDAYQFILLIAAHTDRHTQQIQEVKMNTNFPNL